MLDFIKGSLIAIRIPTIIVENHGLGYQIFFSKNQISLLPPTGTTLSLYLAMIIREDAHTLYGFLHQEERALFHTLSRISGIGPKTAFTILSHTSPSDFVTAIRNKNSSKLAQIPGIGKKTIDRLCLELPDRLSTFEFSHPTPHADSSSDAISALIALGYDKIRAKEAIRRVYLDAEQKTPLSEIIKSALQVIRNC